LVLLNEFNDELIVWFLLLNSESKYFDVDNGLLMEYDNLPFEDILEFGFVFV